MARKVTVTRTNGAVPMVAADTLHNLLSGMGTSGDKQIGASWFFREMAREQLESAYRSDWIARKVIDIPAFDATRSWRDWQADKDDITKIEKLEKQFKLKRKLMGALQKARLYGGAALIMGVNQGRPEEELKIDSVKKDGLKFVHVVNRHEITAGQLIQDIESPWFQEPEYYERTIMGGNTKALRLHPSRVVRLLGAEPPDMTRSVQGWGDPVLQIVSDAIKAAGTVANGVAQLVDEAKVDVIKIPGLTENIASPEYEKRIRKRFGLASDAKSIYRMLLLDGEEEWQRITQTFAQLPEVMQMYMILTSGAADIPVTRMMGEAPKGLNATGQSDIRNYYDMVNTKQEMDIGPALERLDEVLIRSALGSRPEEAHYTWKPLWQMDETQVAEIALKKAQAHKVDVDSGLLAPEVLKEARENQLIEDGTYPGLETIIEDYEAAIEAGLIPDPNDPTNAQPTDPQGNALGPDGKPLPAKLGPDGKPLPAAPVLAKPTMSLRRMATAAGDRMVSRIRDAKTVAVLQDAKPKTLYVRRNVLNWAQLAGHFKKQGFKTTLSEAMHVTIAYSKIPVDWMKAGNDWSSDEHGNLTIKPGGVRMVDRFDDNASVLMFVSNELSWRWCEIKDRTGAAWKWPDYQPHITISLDGPEDLSKVLPYIGAIKLGPELFNETTKDWAEEVIEDAKWHRLWPDQPAREDVLTSVVDAIKAQSPPVVNVTVPVTVQDKKTGKKTTRVTKHDAKGRIQEYETSED